MTEQKLTVMGLRQKGFRVDISHLRRVKGIAGALVSKWEVSNRDLIAPKGGATEARIVTPDGKESRGVVNCFWKDAYCRKEGIHYALERALENLKEEA